MFRNKLTGVRRRTLVLTMGIVASLATLGFASSALATEHHPTGEWAQFKDCPLSNSATDLCIYATTESGEFIVGKETVPIAKAITLQGGLHEAEEGKLEFIGAENGETLSKTPQKVPGGLAGLVKCNEISNWFERIACELIFENGATGVNATTELAEPASKIGINVENLITTEGTALSLPVKVHLENPLLGSECYVGSNSHPVDIALTTGTTSPPEPNKPITGSVGELSFNSNFTLVTVKNNKLVNNSFAAPGAEGCGGLFSFLIDPIVDSKLGIPAAAGHNTAILKGVLKTGVATEVKASE
ncbi:MAG: hypothetical protein ACLPUT_02240 [Solirubrobacteraceae bacterium]